ncbi:MAG TPA: MFS transporter, partial [Candidatus Aminicenantes bacterium]|nr:MFS transporter [Candidatus Aminicenantes bacterium]
RRSDRVGRKRVLVAGYLTFAIVYAGFAWGGNRGVIVAAFALYGVFTALTAGVERAFIAEIAPTELKGTLLGLHSTVVGIALLPASVIAGLLWNAFGPVVPFSFGAGLSLAAALILALGLPPGGRERLSARSPSGTRPL